LYPLPDGSFGPRFGLVEVGQIFDAKRLSYLEYHLFDYLVSNCSAALSPDLK
jgi:hypothetical protein